MIRSHQRRASLLIGAAVVLMLVGFATGWWVALQRGQERDAAQREAVTAQVETDVAQRKARDVIDCVKDPSTSDRECRETANDAEDVLDGIDSAPVSNELSPAQRAEVILLASQILDDEPTLSEAAVVSRVLSRLPAPKRGPQGEPGRTPSLAQVRLLIAAVYAANPPPAGTDGEPGAQGQTGDQGPEGPPGPAGVDGKNGTDGKDGRGVESATCGESGRWTVTYTDGTTSDGGECRTSVLPPPAE